MVTGAVFQKLPGTGALNGLHDAVTLAAGANISISNNGNTLTIVGPSGGGGGWGLSGNAGTTAGANFIGTTDNQAWEVHVNGQRALRVEPDITGQNSPAFIAGSSANSANSARRRHWRRLRQMILAAGTNAVISGGYFNRIQSSAESTIGGGYVNQILTGANFATISGGGDNTNSGLNATIGGGAHNTAASGDATIGGGNGNTIKNSGTPYGA